MRTLFVLSEITFPIDKLLESSAHGNDEDSSKNLSYFRAIDTLYNTEVEAKNQSAYRNLIASPLLQAFIKENKLVIKSKTTLSSALNKGNLEYFVLSFSGSTGFLSIVPFIGDKLEQVTFDKKTIDSLSVLLKNIDSHAALLDSTLTKLFKVKEDKALIDTLKEKECTIRVEEETNGIYAFGIAKNNTSLLRFGLDKKTLEYFVNDDRRFRVYEDFKIALIDTVTTIDTRGENEKILDTIRAEIGALTSDKTFLTLLESKKLKLSATPRSDYYFIYYDVTDSANRKIGSIAIDKFHPTTYIMDKDDVQISSLKALVEPDGENVKKN
jgi:hypothetical protein